ncbi:hypothetical protein B0T25DRAFT_581423 [Lasiosphaeria hispida]|uniref:DDE Tnp4 domain-containing protein n=1 Tax=Lasiosphaeria hispida TaxID=260671 RepID=A0AAJ0MEZ6_9PEZI|nr:hypothetical protein B0T25DRAFT_581423 [Lasiosphaeria hispida]
MDSDASVNDWSSGDEPEHRLPNAANLESRPVRNAAPQRGQLRPARKTLPFVPYTDWVPGQSYEEHPPYCIHYIMEWKLTLNKRTAAKQTEDNLVVAPSNFWNEELPRFESLHKAFVRLPPDDWLDPDVELNPKTNAFNGCIGAVDGTHIAAHIRLRRGSLANY